MTLSQSLYTCSFVIVCVSMWVAAIANADRTKKTHIQLDAAVNVIAGLFYIAIIAMPTWLRQLRYADWFLTTPIMLCALVLHANRNLNARNFLRKNSFKVSLMLLMNAMMITTGYLNKSNQFNYIYVLSILLFIRVFGILHQLMTGNESVDDNNHRDRRKPRHLYFATLVTWGLYGAVFLIRNVRIRAVCNNMLDFVSKIAIPWTFVHFIS